MDCTISETGQFDARKSRYFIILLREPLMNELQTCEPRLVILAINDTYFSLVESGCYKKKYCI